jgi:hypothetical protein
LYVNFYVCRVCLPPTFHHALYLKHVSQEYASNTALYSRKLT